MWGFRNEMQQGFMYPPLQASKQGLGTAPCIASNLLPLLHSTLYQVGFDSCST